MNLQSAILSTLAYHAIFNYPLTLEEIHKYLIEKSSTPAQIQLQLQKLVKEKKVSQIRNYYCLKGREEMAGIRKQRQKYSIQKLKKARIYGNILKAIPSVKVVAVTGALAMENSTKNDDIDYAIITQKGQLWTTRLGANLLLFPFKRSPGSKVQKNRVCLNLFLSRNSLKIRTRNLYLAHEIVQLKPLWQRQNAYFSFLKANSWVQNYLPNWKADFVVSNQKAKRQTTKDQRKIKSLDVRHLALVVETFAKKFQLAYMKSKITTEQIGETQLFFHPSDTQNWVLSQYQKNLKKFKVLR